MRRMKNTDSPSFALRASIVFLVAAGWIACAASGALAGAKTSRPRVPFDVDQLPLHFIENAGQVDPQVRYYVQGFDKTFYFTARGVTLAFEERGAFQQAPRLVSAALDGAPAPGEQRRVALKLDFVGANKDAKLLGEEQAAALVSYFKGRPSEWKTGLKTYKKLVYRDLWPGIDLVYSGTVQRLKYVFVVKPGADPTLIKLAYHGADAVNVDDQGRLDVRTALGGFHDDKPVAYQTIDGEEKDVSVAYRSDASTGAGSFPYGFRLGSYDSSLPLVIDPAILVYAGFVGGTGADRGNGVAVDANGSAYVTGETSSVANFPVKTGPDVSPNGGIDAFVAKVAPDGRTLIYAGFIGGAGTDRGLGIAVDGARNAYVTGETNSGVNFPALAGPDLSHNGAFDAFVAKLNASGTALVYAGFVGGTLDDRGNAIALEQGCMSNCAAYITGETSSFGNSFPDGNGFGGVPGFDQVENGAVDAFIAQVDSTGSVLVYATFVGGSGDDRGKGIAVGGDGSAYVTGETNSFGSFPDGDGFGSSIPGLDQIGNGAVDAFVVKVDPTGTMLDYAGFIGGLSDDRGNAIAIEPGCMSDCAAYIAGETSSSEGSFPETVGPDFIYNGGIDAFVAKVAGDGLSLVYAGYIGGSGDDRGHGIAVDAGGSAHVTGETNSGASFPAAGGPDATASGGIDAFVAQVSATGNALVYASFIGGLGTDRGKGIAVDNAGDVYVAGETDSDHVSFPKKVGPDPLVSGGFDAFVAKICVSGCADLRVAIADAPDPVRVGENITYTVTVTNGGPDSANNVALTITLPGTVTFVSSTPTAPTCVFTVALDCDLGNLNNGANTVVTLVVTTTAKKLLRLVADVSADETDTDPRNDQASETTNATFGNLVVRAIAISPTAVLPGDMITIDDTTRNNGTVDAGVPSFTRFYLSTNARFDSGVDMLLGSRMVPALVSKASDSGSTTVTIPLATALGRYRIIGIADADNVVPETIENNRKSRVIQVTRPDLQISNLRAPASAAAGANITIDDTTINKSPLGAGASTTSFFLSTDAISDPGDVPLMNNSRAVPALAPKGKHAASTTATIPAGTAPGKYFLIAVADANGAVNEADETDNTRARRITVTP
jgi:uncharacterized repeat protein (TIGR01451 family)